MTENDYIAEYVREKYPSILGFDYGLWKTVKMVRTTIKEVVEILLGTENEDKELPNWIGKRCEDCGNKKCKELGKLPKGYDCALWQAESEDEE